jgi:dihydrofolate reductase
VIVSLIAAIDQQRGMGRDGGLPWHLSDDLQHFKRVTLGHHLILGRRTFEGLRVALQGRRLIVLSGNTEYQAEGAQVAASLDEALALAEAAGENEAFVGGGAQVFAAALPLADRFYLTRVEAALEVDTVFPEFDIDEWKLVESQPFEQGGKNEYDFTIQVLERLH